MVTRNHFECAGWKDGENGFKVGRFDIPMGFRKEAVEMKGLVREAEREGEEEPKGTSTFALI